MATAKKPRAPRPTAEERRAAQAEKRAQEAARQAAAWEEFNQKRPQVWVSMWAKALRLSLLVQTEEEFRESYSWWFDDFRVDPKAQCFYLDDTGSLLISEEKLHPSDVDRINQSLDQAFDWLNDFWEQKERQRLEELERQRKREAALAKLNDEERRLLGLR